MQSVLLITLAVTSAAIAAPPTVKDFTVPAVTSVPYTYCIWYLPDPDKESFLKPLAASPPDLFHLGYHIPFKGALGPAYGHELFSDAILPPDQIPREVERDQQIIRKMRAAGVTRIIPYVYSMAFFGNPDTRTGFFHFFDHWDDYRAFGLGPKPDADPSLWSQVPGPRPLGNGPAEVFHYDPCINHPAWSEYLDLVVRQLAGVGYGGMFFDVNTQYCYCPHCQEKFDVYLLNKYGRAGLREIFGTDDHRALNLSTIYRDFEETILHAFKTYLRDTWEKNHFSEILGAAGPSTVTLEEDWRLLRCYMHGSPAEFPPVDRFDAYIEKRFGGTRADKVAPDKRADFVQTVLRKQFHDFLEGSDLAALLQQRFGSSDIRRRCCSNPRDLLLWVETQRFWCDSMAATFSRLKHVGRAAMPQPDRDFYTVANLGSMSTIDGLDKRRVDGIDLVRWAPMTDMQMFEEMPQPGSLESGVIISNVFAFRWAMAAGTRAGTLLYQAIDDRAADLAEAEAAAGGGGAFIQPKLEAPASRKRWKQFLAEHADLWDGGVSAARVGVLFWSGQVFYEYPEHLAMAHRLARVFAETQVPFDFITERALATLTRYDLVVAPMLRYLDPPQLDAIINYARAGGKLVVIDPFGSEDKCVRPHSSDPLDAVCAKTDKGLRPLVWQPLVCGEGRILRLSPESVPARQSDFWCLMEERGGDFLRARQYLNEARRNDLANNVDLGPRFVRHLEETLSMRLRWSADDTDPGVYLHAYRIPAKDARPERLVLHAVNYRLPIRVKTDPGKQDDPIWNMETQSGPPKVMRHLRVAVPLPPGTKVKCVTPLSPTDHNNSVKWNVESNLLILTVDRLEIYRAIAIDLGL